MLVWNFKVHAKIEQNLKKEQDMRKLKATIEARLGLAMGGLVMGWDGIHTH